MDFFDAGGILHGQRRDGRQAMTAQAGAGDGIRGQAVGSRGIERAEDRACGWMSPDEYLIVLPYGEVAAELGDPGLARAVGQAMGANPFAPVVPCHRVLAAGHQPGGFSARGGALTKLRMLAIEGAVPGGTPYLFAGL